MWSIPARKVLGRAVGVLPLSITRCSPLGLLCRVQHNNPFPIGPRFGNRVEVVDRYRRHLWERILSGEVALEDLAALAGKPLACWCHPKRPCHAEVLARAAAWAAGQLEKSSETP